MINIGRKVDRFAGRSWLHRSLSPTSPISDVKPEAWDYNYLLSLIKQNSSWTLEHTKNFQMGNQAGKEKLSKADVEFLKTNTRYDEDTIQQWFKGFMKDCPQGKLSPPMFIKIYSKCFPGGFQSHTGAGERLHWNISGNAEEFCTHVFRTFDSDKNGTIDFKEFLLAIDVSCVFLVWKIRQFISVINF